MELQEAACWEAPAPHPRCCHPAVSSSASASSTATATATAPGTVVSSLASDCGRPDEEEGEWPANPWQAQADAHMWQLQQADGGGTVFGLPAALCSVALQGQHGPGWRFPLLPPQLPRGTAAEAAPRGAVDAATQTGDELASRINDLEGQLAMHEDTMARRDQEIRNLRAQLGALGPQRAAGAEQRRAEIEGLRQTAEELRRRNEFLNAIVSRFEGKTIGLQRQVESMKIARSEAEARANAEEAAAKEAQRLREACLAAEAEAASRLDALRGAEARGQALLAAHAEAAESAAEHREAAESAGVFVRDLKKEHNRRMQDVLRRVQVLESRRQDLGGSKKQGGQPESAQALSASSEAQASSPPAASISKEEAQESKEISGTAELKKLKDLNTQLVERLAQERSAHTEAQATLEALSSDNGTLSTRVDQLNEQLIYLSDLNDELREEMGAATASCCAAMTGVDCDRLDSMS